MLIISLENLFYYQYSDHKHVLRFKLKVSKTPLLTKWKTQKYVLWAYVEVFY